MPADTTASASTSENGATYAGALLETRDLRKTYGSGEAEITVLSGISVSVEAGKLIAVIGPSGAGKSTFLHLLAALDTPTSGTVYFEGKAIDSFRESELADYRNRSIGFVWQRHHLLADFTAAENVAMPLLMRGAGYDEALETSERWLGKLVWEHGKTARRGVVRRGATARGHCPRARSAAGPAAGGRTHRRSGRAKRSRVFELMQRLHRDAPAHLDPGDAQHGSGGARGSRAATWSTERSSRLRNRPTAPVFCTEGETS